MIELGFLGTGGAFSLAERDNASLLIKSERATVLVDAPGSAIQKIQKLGSHPSEVGAILITHIHADHIYGLPSIFHSLMLRPGKVLVYGSEETVAFCARSLDLYGLRDPKYKTQAELRPVRADRAFRIEGLGEVRPLAVRHHSSSLAFLLQPESGPVFLYSGDTAAEPSLFKREGKVQALCHDASAPDRFFEQYPILAALHTSSLRLGRMAADAGVETLIPIHFFGEVDFALTEIEAEVRAAFGGRLIIPRDLDKVEL